MKPLCLLCAALVLSPAWGRTSKPDRSGEALLLQVLRDLRSVPGWHLRIVRETREVEGGAFLADRVTEVWLDRSGAVRLEMVDYWGDGGVWVRDRTWSVIDRLGPLGDALVEPAKGSWREPGDLRRFAGDAGTPLFDAIAGKPGDLDALVAKDGEIVEGRASGRVRVLKLHSPNREPLELGMMRGPGGWRVVSLEYGDAAGGRTSRETVQVLPQGPRSRFDTSTWKQRTSGSAGRGTIAVTGGL